MRSRTAVYPAYNSRLVRACRNVLRVINNLPSFQLAALLQLACVLSLLRVPKPQVHSGTEVVLSECLSFHYRSRRRILVKHRAGAVTAPWVHGHITQAVSCWHQTTIRSSPYAIEHLSIHRFKGFA